MFPTNSKLHFIQGYRKTASIMGLFGSKKNISAERDDQNGNSNDDIVSLDDNALDQAASGAGGATVVVPNYSRTYEEDDDGVQYSTSYGDTSEEQKQFSCCQRFKSELNPCSPWFTVSDEAMGRSLDVSESFAPASCYAFVWKLACTAIAILTLAWQFVDDYAYFVLAYFTNWGVTFVCIYFIFNVLNTVCASRTLQPTTNASVGCRIRITWLMYAIGVHSTAGATLFYWVFLFDPSDPDWTFTNMSAHGGLLLLMVIDGMFVNRIPLRWQHWYAVLLVDIAYVGWTLIHAYLDVGNPYLEDNDPATNDDAIYDVVEWKDDFQSALIYSCINCFVLSPIIYILLWCLSNGVCWDRRKFVDAVDLQDQRPTVDDVEEGSIFAKWR